MAIYDDLRAAINEAATEVGASGKEFKISDVRDWIMSHKTTDWPRFEPSFQGHFSYAVTSDSECLVERVPGKYLYRLSIPHVTLAPIPVAGPSEETSGTSVPAVKGKSQRESKLYEVLRLWLEAKGYQAEVTASAKSGGTWGNPDVTGLRLDEMPIGTAGIESVTVEAKLSSDSWRYFIFEAVAHKRFAHRAWFAFAFGTDSPSISQVKDAEQMSLYAEKYRIGILVVFVSSQKYEQLTKGDPTSLILDSDDVRVEVLWPAAYEQVHIPSLSDFLLGFLEIKNHNDLGRFGR